MVVQFLASTLPDFAAPDLKMKGSILAFTILFGVFVAIGTSFVDALKSLLIYCDDCRFIYRAWIDDPRN